MKTKNNAGGNMMELDRKEADNSNKAENGGTRYLTPPPSHQKKRNPSTKVAWQLTPDLDTRDGNSGPRPANEQIDHSLTSRGTHGSYE